MDNTVNHLFNQALREHRKNNIKEAYSLYVRVLQHDVFHSGSLVNLGIILKNLGKYEAALLYYKRALNLDINSDKINVNIANCYVGLGRYGEALAIQNSIIDKYSDQAEAYLNRALTHRSLCNIDACLADLDTAIDIKPEYHQAKYERAITMLMAGVSENSQALLQTGFEALACRQQFIPQQEQYLPDTGKQWQGEADIFGKTILLIGEQNFGECLQFLRYVKFFKEQGSKVFCHLPKDLCRLLNRGHFEIDMVVPHSMPSPECDYYIDLLSLPKYIADFTDSDKYSHYINLPKPFKEQDSYKNIALVWDSRNKNINGVNNPKLADFKELLECPDINFHNFQILPRNNDVSLNNFDGLLTNQTVDITDLHDIAIRLQHMDEVVCVDSYMAHLAGSMGLKVHLLMPQVSDWRWGISSQQIEKSLWYPNTIIYRQSQFGKWHDVVVKITQAISTFDSEDAKQRLRNKQLEREFV
jgi:tetratricopeptide (TPR) repeat protein